MRRNGSNITNGVFDVRKEATIVGNIVVDALISPTKIIRKEEGDKAVDIIVSVFISYRQLNNILNADNLEYSNELARLVLDALMKAQMISLEHRELAFGVIAEEILVARCIETMT